MLILCNKHEEFKSLCVRKPEFLNSCFSWLNCKADNISSVQTERTGDKFVYSHNILDFTEIIGYN